MSKPTDTNQASEDELRAEILTEFKQVYKLAPADYTENCTNVVMSIIRTEKLKLLEEVRERVIGEDLPPDIATDSGIGYSRQQFAINMGKAGQRRELNKMEVEL